MFRFFLFVFGFVIIGYISIFFIIRYIIAPLKKLGREEQKLNDKWNKNWDDGNKKDNKKN